MHTAFIHAGTVGQTIDHQREWHQLKFLQLNCCILSFFFLLLGLVEQEFANAKVIDQGDLIFSEVSTPKF